MNFKITDVIYTGDEKKPDAQKDFLSKLGKFGNKSQLKSKPLEINQENDQRNQPYIPSPEETQTQTQGIPNSNQKQENTNNLYDSQNCQLPKINPIKTLPIHIFPISNEKVAYSEQDEHRINIDINPQKDPILNPIHKLLDCERQIKNYEKSKKDRHQKQSETQIRYIGQKKAVLPQFFNSTDKTTIPEKPTLLSEDYYYNNLVDKGEWSVIWDPQKIKKVPLILDKSDKYVSSSNSSDSETKSPKDWNQLNLLDTKINYYSEFVGVEDKNDLEICHSNVSNSLSLFEPNDPDPNHFHHPLYKARLNKEIPIEILRSQKVENDGSFQLNSVESLSGKNGQIFVIENISENQPFILNVGMNSLLLTYLFIDDGEFDFSTLNEDLEKNLRIVNNNEKSPFVAQLPRKIPIQAIYCPLFRMPIAMHTKSDTDFLFVKDKVVNKFYIRSINKIFCAGMSEPQSEVMKPGSTKAQKIQDNLIEAFLINVFRGTSEMKGKNKVTIPKLQRSYFPSLSQHKLREFVKKYAEYKNGFWELKKSDLDSEFDKLGITPEKVCNYQSMLHGLWKLRKEGVNLLKYEPKLHNQINKLKGEKTKIIGEKIELELMKTPWMKTSNFIGAFQSNAVEMENADGETIYKKKSRRSQKAEKREKITSNETEKKDLRSLTMKEINNILLNNKFTEDQLEKLPRWDKIKIVRQIANNKQEENPNDEFSRKFARKKNKFQEMCEKYKNYYQQSFDNNLITISSVQPTTEKDGFDVDDDGFLNELGEMMNNENNEFDEDEEEENFETNNSSKINSIDSADPKKLIPYGICTYPTKIDWKSYGFDQNKIKMRPVVKLIRVSLRKSGKVSANVHWIRNPQDVNECKKKNKVYQEISKNKIIKKKSKSKKLNKNDVNDKNDLLVSKENGGDQLKIKISSDSLSQINDARKIYDNYKKNGNSS